MRYNLKKGMKSLNRQVEIIDIDKFCLLVKNISRNSTGIRTVSKEIVNEFVNYFEKHPNNSAQQAREELAGLSQIDKFEYGYCSTLTILAKMILGVELSDEDKKLSAITSHTFSNIPLQVIYYGAPGTGKSYTIDKITTEENSVRTTFHPDSDYASFVGAYKPTMEESPISAIVGKEVHEAVPQGKHPGTEKKIVYKYVPQAFLKAYVEAWKRYADNQNLIMPGDITYYLIIEEINRGNCAQIFGDLFQLLDRNNSGASSYPIHADEDIARFLKEDDKGFKALSEEQKTAISNFILRKDSGEERKLGEDILNGKLLLLPPNLRIWATMNTSDQSLFPIDSAFKRRWDWTYMPIDYNPRDKKTNREILWRFQIGDKLYDWGDFLKKINHHIEHLTESADKQMGYFFAKANPATGIISEEIFKNKVLFFLWTEVLKDYDMGNESFINPETGKTFKFTDFFDSEQNALVNFIEKINPAQASSEEELRDGYVSIKVAVNGRQVNTMTQAVISILEIAARSYSMEEIEKGVGETITRGEYPIIKRVAEPESYTKENRWNSTIIESKDGVSFVVTSMWQRQFLPMIENLASYFNVSFEVLNS